MWKNLKGKQKLVYDQISERCRVSPIPYLTYRTFEGVQEYKKMLGFPYMDQSYLEPIE